jgi:hypothetical protein
MRWPCPSQGYLPIRQSPSMFLCSSFSIAAGGSLGPEAPLLALCAATTSWLGRKVCPGEEPPIDLSKAEQPPLKHSSHYVLRAKRYRPQHCEGIMHDA